MEYDCEGQDRVSLKIKIGSSLSCNIYARDIGIVYRRPGAEWTLAYEDITCMGTESSELEASFR